MKKTRQTSILGLALEGHQLDAVQLKRTNGSVALQKKCSATLALDPLTNEPELVGREIRNQLDAAGIREKYCVIGLPSHWAFTLQTKIPDLPEEDVKSLLEIEAERGFPYGPESLIISTLRYGAPGGEQHATLLAVQREHLTRLETVLKHAKLKPLSYSLNLSALPIGNRDAQKGVITLAIGEMIGLQVSFGGGIPALRMLEGAIENEPGKRRIRPEIIARECRITLGQLPDTLRENVREMRVFGEQEIVQTLVQSIRPQMSAMGIRVDGVNKFTVEDFGLQVPPDAPVSAAFSLAARYLAGTPPPFEFLLPKISQWQQLTAKYSSKKLGTVTAIAAAIIFVIGGAFAFQQWRLSHLRSEWDRMRPRVSDLENLQQQIRKYRPWYDNSLRSLSILRRLTEAFPEDGVVTAKNVEIHELSTVSCSGSARDSQALLRTLDKLRAMPEVGDVKVDQLRGKSPIEFMFNFHWGVKGND
jgi:hypothetical protein